MPQLETLVKRGPKMYCEFCGKPVSDYAKYCRSCGATLEYYKSEQQIRTPEETGKEQGESNEA